MTGVRRRSFIYAIGENAVRARPDGSFRYGTTLRGFNDAYGEFGPSGNRARTPRLAGRHTTETPRDLD